MNKINPLLVILLCGVFLGGAAVYSHFRTESPTKENYRRGYDVLIGKNISKLYNHNSLASDKRDVDLSTGRLLIILGNTGCSACGKELQTLSESNLDGIQKAVFISSEPADRIGEELSKFDGLDKRLKDKSFDYASKENEQPFKKLNIKFLPTNLIINEGVIQDVFVGAPKDLAMFDEFLHGEIE